MDAYLKFWVISLLFSDAFIYINPEREKTPVTEEVIEL